MEPGDNGTVFYYTPPHFTTECFDKVFPSIKKILIRQDILTPQVSTTSDLFSIKKLTRSFFNND